MVKSGTEQLLLGAVLGAGALFLWEHFRGLSISVSNPPTQTGRSAPATNASYVGFAGGNYLPFQDDLDDTYNVSEVWDRRTSKYKTDGVLYNVLPRGGSGLGLDGRAEWDPNKRLDVAGAYTPKQEDGPRPAQQHAGGSFPECLAQGAQVDCLWPAHASY